MLQLYKLIYFCSLLTEESLCFFVFLSFCLLGGSDCIHHTGRVLSLFITDVLILEHVKDIMFIWVLKLGDETLIAHVSLWCLHSLLHYFGWDWCRIFIFAFDTSVFGSRLQVLGSTCLCDGFKETWVDLLLVLANTARDHGFLLLLVDRQLEVHVELLLGGGKDLITCR